MLIRCGYEISFTASAPTPLMAMLSVHPSRHRDLKTPHRLTTTPEVPIYDYLDAFGNTCTRLIVPEGGITLTCDFVVEDSGLPDRLSPHAIQHPVEDLPDDILVYLLGSRYCETDRLSDTAWALFGHIPPGGTGCRRSSTSRMTASPSAIPTPAPPAPRGTRTRSRSACAATSPTSPSPCAGA